MNSETERASGPGSSHVSPIGIMLIMVYMLLLAGMLLYSLLQFWPSPISGEQSAAPRTVKYFLWTLSISPEAHLIILVAVAGALGSLVHALRSLFAYVGNRNLRMSWVLMYVFLPFIGMILAILFYLVIRGGFFSPTADLNEANPFGFAALGGLVGMFTEQAVAKLKEVAQTVLTKPERLGKVTDSLSEDTRTDT